MLNRRFLEHLENKNVEWLDNEWVEVSFLKQTRRQHKECCEKSQKHDIMKISNVTKLQNLWRKSGTKLVKSSMETRIDRNSSDGSNQWDKDT